MCTWQLPVVLILQNDFQKPRIPHNTDGTNKNKAKQCKLWTASEKKINHCMRGTRIKRHERNVTQSKARINMRTRASALPSVCVYGWGPRRGGRSSCNPTATDTTMSHPGCCSPQTVTGGNSWEASTSHIIVTIPELVCWHKCNQ